MLCLEDRDKCLAVGLVTLKGNREKFKLLSKLIPVVISPKLRANRELYFIQLQRGFNFIQTIETHSHLKQIISRCRHRSDGTSSFKLPPKTLLEFKNYEAELRHSIEQKHFKVSLSRKITEIIPERSAD